MQRLVPAKATLIAPLFAIFLGVGPAAQGCTPATIYGRSTPHCQGSPRISALGCPRTGNSSFAIGVANAIPSSRTLSDCIILGTSKIAAGAGCVALNVLPTRKRAIVIDAQGNGRLALPIPADPELVGRRQYAQFVQTGIDRCFRCRAVVLGVAGSKGLDMLIQPACPVEVVDRFTAPNGSPPNPASWVTDADRDMSPWSVLIQDNRLVLDGTRQSNAIPGGGPGLGVYTKATFARFDLEVRYVTSTFAGGGNNGGAAIAVTDAARLPPSTNHPSAAALITVSWAGDPVTISYGHAGGTVQRNVGTLQDGDAFRIRLTEAGTLEFHHNGNVVWSQPDWAPAAASFVGSLYSHPGGSIGQRRLTYFDDFALCAR